MLGRSTCLLCGIAGEQLYSAVPDRLFGLAGAWNVRRCPSDGLLWLDPMPAPGEVGKLYPSGYYTHAPPPARRSWPVRAAYWCLESVRAGAFAADPRGATGAKRPIGRVLSLFAPLRDGAGADVMFLASRRPGALLDVGSGSGRLLGEMRRSGWDVLGVEPDAAAARDASERYGVSVVAGTLADLGPARPKFDAVTLSHVLEHVHDPVDMLRDCWARLLPGGELVVLTPNAESVGHHTFHSMWPGLDPPRHLHVFSPRALDTCARQAGIAPRRLRTVARLAMHMWLTGRALRAGRRLRAGAPERGTDPPGL